MARPLSTTAQIAAARRELYNEMFRRGELYRSDLEFITRTTRSSLSQTNGIVARDLVASAASGLSGQAAQAVSIFAGSLASKFSRNRDKRLASLHQTVAKQAQDASVSLYRSRREVSASYRENAPGKYRRDAGGKLERALRSPTMTLASWDGIQAINVYHLDKQARQWYRLNFGTGKDGKYSHRDYRLQFFGQSVASPFSLARFGVSKSGPFRIPRGIWTDRDPDRVGLANAGKGSTFFSPVGYLKQQGHIEKYQATPASERQPFNVSEVRYGSIAPLAFLDAYPRIIARNLPVGYEELMRQWFHEAATTKSGPIAKFGVTGSEANTYLKLAAADVEKRVKLASQRNVLERLRFRT